MTEPPKPPLFTWRKAAYWVAIVLAALAIVAALLALVVAVQV